MAQERQDKDSQVDEVAPVSPEPPRNLTNYLTESTQIPRSQAHNSDKICDNLREAQPVSATPERSNQDYAIEHAGYLANAAERYLEARNEYDRLEAMDGDGDTDSLGDYYRALKSAIYEFRQRAMRAAQSLSANTPQPEFCEEPIDPRNDSCAHAGCTNPKRKNGGYCEGHYRVFREWLEREGYGDEANEALGPYGAEAQPGSADKEQEC